LAAPQDGAKVLASLKSTDKLVYLGEEKDGYLKVQSPDAEGWVKKALVKK
jgi:SH3-like domain-containing protein